MEVIKAPEIKTIHGTVRRFKRTGKGGSKHKHTGLRYILTKKAARRRRRLRPKATVFRGDLGLVITYLPHV